MNNLKEAFFVTLQWQVSSHKWVVEVPLGSQLQDSHLGQVVSSDAHFSHFSPAYPSRQMHLPASSPYCIQDDVPTLSQTHGRHGWNAEGDVVNGRK